MFDIRLTWPLKISQKKKLPSWELIMVPCAGAFALVASPAFAGAGTGPISNVTVQPTSNVALFALTPVQSPLPACATSGRFAIYISNPGGQAALALVMTAYSQGKKVFVAGTGVCDVWNDSETLSYIISP